MPETEIAGLSGDSHAQSVRIVQLRDFTSLEIRCESLNKFEGQPRKWIINCLFVSTNQISGIWTEYRMAMTKKDEDDVERIGWGKNPILQSTDSTVGGLQAQPQQCWVMPSWATLFDYKHEITTLRLSLPVSLFVCAPINTCLCVSIRGGHVANRKVLKKSLFSKQCTDTGNNVVALRGHNGDSGTDKRAKK